MVPTIVTAHTFYASQNNPEYLILRFPIGGAYQYRDIFCAV